MKLCYSWLKEFLPIDTPPQELAKHLGLLGFEVSSIETLGPGFSGVVTVEILSIQKHPNADRLSLCQVSDGRRTYSVVCGASNIAVGQRVPLACVGAKLPGGVMIAQAKIRGTSSEGMLCTAAELGLPENGDENRGIHILPAHTALGIDLRRLLGIRDWVLDVEITPNRPDCLSHYGLARELAIYFDLPLKSLEEAPFPATSSETLPVENQEPESCPRYLGRLFSGLRVGPSPAWLAERLSAVSLRPINNVVDITNYILLEMGQPLHAFDRDKLQGGRILVRSARSGEILRALDGREHRLTSQNLVIADAERPIAIAGVLGGEESGVTEKTTRIFLECAYFAPRRIRQSAKALALRTESSYRFERGTDVSAPPLACHRAAALIARLCGKNVQAGGLNDIYPKPAQPPVIEVSSDRINSILGASYPSQAIEKKLERLGQRCEKTQEGLRLLAPTHRVDLKTPWDLAEEIGRHLGYQDIPYDMAPVRLKSSPPLPMVECLDRIRSLLNGLGFCEATNYDFISPADLKRCSLDPGSPEFIELLNPLSSDLSLLRPSLLIGLLRNAQLNSRQGAKGLRFFEAGKIYHREGAKLHESMSLAGLLAGPKTDAHWMAEYRTQDPSQQNFFDAKAAVEYLTQGLNARWETPLNPGVFFHPKACAELRRGGVRMGLIGLIHPDIAVSWDLRDPALALFTLDLEALAQAPLPEKRFSPYSHFPSSLRDISILVDLSLSFKEILECLNQVQKNLPALRLYTLADYYSGKKLPRGKRSLMLRFTFQLPDRTLRDEEVARYTHDILKSLKERCGAVLRS